MDFKHHTFDYNWICPGKDAKYPIIQGFAWKDVWRRKFEHDKNSIVTDSIAFINPAKGDFTPKNGNILKKLGIKPVKVDKCGLYVSKFRPFIPKEREGAANHPEWFKNPVHINPPKEKNPPEGFSR